MLAGPRACLRDCNKCIHPTNSLYQKLWTHLDKREKHALRLTNKFKAKKVKISNFFIGGEIETSGTHVKREANSSGHFISVPRQSRIPLQGKFLRHL